MELHERIKEIRKHFRLNQTEFGARLGVSRDVIKNIELDRLKKPEQKEPLLKLICREFDVSENWLRFEDGEMFRPLSADEKLAGFMGALMNCDDSDPVKKLLIGFVELSPEEQEQMKSLMKKILENREK